MTLYFLHESLKFVRIVREKNRHFNITCTSFFHLFDWVVGWIPYCHTREFIGFSICSTKAGTLLSCVASTASNPESGDSTVVLLNFGGILQQKVCATVEYAQLDIQNKKYIDVPQRCVPPGVPKICFGWILVQNIQKHGNW